MSIERLNKAASAAGFAMATPDDDTGAIETLTENEARTESRALVVSTPTSRLLHGDTLSAVSTWAKGVWPTFGWRQPA